MRYPVRLPGAGTVTERPLPAEPTGAAPGSEAKLQIFEERAAAHTQLFHPRDNTELLGAAQELAIRAIIPGMCAGSMRIRELPISHVFGAGVNGS
jgi:hypothetical protein